MNCPTLTENGECLPVFLALFLTSECDRMNVVFQEVVESLNTKNNYDYRGVGLFVFTS